MTKTRRIMTLAIVSSLLALQPLHAEDLAETSEESSPNTKVLWHDARMLASIHLSAAPDLDPKLPHTLIIALHGYGSSAGRFQSIADELAKGGFLVAVPEAPYPIQTEIGIGFDWILGHQRNAALSQRAANLLILDHLSEALAELRRNYAIDRVYILGFSQGATVALLAGIYNRGVYDGVISFGLSRFDSAWFDESVLALGGSTRILLAHGTEDDRTPIAVSELARDKLSAAGYQVTFRSFPAGHTIPIDQIAFVREWVGTVAVEK